MHDRLAAAGNSTGEAKEKRAEEEAPLKPVFVHGWVYDLESGTVTDLNISTGPAGFEDFVPSPTEETGEGEASTTTSEEPASTTATATTTEESVTETSSEGAAEETTESVAPSTDAGPEPASPTPGPDVTVVGHTTIPVKRSNMLARLRRSLPQQGSYRFSRQV